MRYRVIAHDRHGRTIESYNTNGLTENPGAVRANALARCPHAHSVRVEAIHEAREGDPCPRCLGGDYVLRFRNYGCACGGPGCPLD